MKEPNASHDNNNNNSHHSLGVSKNSSKVGKGVNKRGSSNGTIPARTPVYTIDKSDFRNTVQMLTGSHSPSNINNNTSNKNSNNNNNNAVNNDVNGQTASRLHQIRPPPLYGLPRPPLPLPNFGTSPPVMSFDGNVQVPFDVFWAENSRQRQQQSFPAPAPAPPSIWIDPSSRAAGTRTPGQLLSPFPVTGSRCFPSPGSQMASAFISPLPSPSGMPFPLSPRDWFSLSPVGLTSPTSLFAEASRGFGDFSFPHGHM